MDTNINALCDFIKAHLDPPCFLQHAQRRRGARREMCEGNRECRWKEHGFEMCWVYDRLGTVGVYARVRRTWQVRGLAGVPFEV